MGIGLKVGNETYELGTSDFLYAFFSTVRHHLDKRRWWPAYPNILRKLYKGELSAADADPALAELHEIQEKFRAYSPQQVIWDIDDLSKHPPWNNNISPDITNLSNYFVTSHGRDLFEVLDEG